jgi:hypothetical protein
VKKKTCCEEGCKTRPIYNTEGETKALYCSAHKKDGMVDVISKTCCEEGCKTIPNYNTEGETKPLYCSAHKKEGMVDVKNKTCCEEGCKTRPIYNTEGETKALYCSAHKKEGMVNVKNKTCCEEGCKRRRIYNTEGETKPLYCSAHKKDGMVDVISKTCKSEWCSTRIRQKYDGYCLFCFMNLFPDKPVTRNYKTKEFAVVEYVKTRFPGVDWVEDKSVNNGCSKKRPDLLLDLGYQILIIEVDENQHTGSGYECSCENKRIMELSQDVGHRPIVFIRFNPDKYVKYGENVSSCWGINKNGICCVNESKKKEWSHRLSILEEQIEYWLNPLHTTNKIVETFQLFYDV